MSTGGPLVRTAAQVGEQAHQDTASVGGAATSPPTESDCAATPEIIDLSQTTHTDLGPSEHHDCENPSVPPGYQRVWTSEGMMEVPVITVPPSLMMEESEEPVHYPLAEKCDVPETMPACAEDGKPVSVEEHTACFWNCLIDHIMSMAKEAAPMPHEEGAAEEAEPVSMPHEETQPQSHKPEHMPMPMEIDDEMSEPKVDTMEFRKSDAKKGEFAPKPY
jgi:hypothetical protein